MNFYKDHTLKDPLPWKLKSACTWTALWFYNIAIEWYEEELHIVILTFLFTIYLETIQKHRLFINFLTCCNLIASGELKFISSSLVLQRKVCIFQCYNQWLSRHQLFQNGFLRKQGWWDHLKLIPMSLTDFWIHCPISILQRKQESHNWLLKPDARQSISVRSWFKKKSDFRCQQGSSGDYLLKEKRHFTQSYWYTM